MRHHFWLVLGFGLFVSLGGWTSDARAQSGYTVLVGDSSTLTINAIPLQAQVRLDAVPIGTAHDFVGRPVTVLPGQHVLEVAAPGYLPATVAVSSTVDWATRVWLELVPDRSR